MNAQRDELDRWLDDALADYKAPAPRPGLELRALAYVRSKHHDPRFVTWRGWALAVAALILIAAAVQMYRKTSLRAQPIAHAPAPSVVAPPASTLAPVLTRRVVRPRSSRLSPAVDTATIAVKPEPRRDVFPSPQPLTAEERMLLSVVAHSPQAMTELARVHEPLTPVVVDEIKIQPLEEKGTNPTGEKK